VIFQPPYCIIWGRGVAVGWGRVFESSKKSSKKSSKNSSKKSSNLGRAEGVITPKKTFGVRGWRGGGVGWGVL
jgi:hypothetical protein